MHKILQLVRELLPQTAPDAQPEVFGAQLLDDMAAPYVGTRTRLAFCFGSQLWSDMVCDSVFAENFEPALQHEEVAEGYMGCYKWVPLYTDAFESNSADGFLPQRHLVLALISEDDTVGALLRLDTLPGVRPYIPADGTQHNAEPVERRKSILRHNKKFPEVPYYAEIETVEK